MSKIERIQLPALGSLRYRKVDDAWLIVGASTDMATMVRAGGAWVLTRKGPRVILVDRAVRVEGAIAIVPQEPGDFATETASDAKPATKSIADVSDDELAAELARRNGGSKATTSRGKRTSGTSGTSTPRNASSTRSRSTSKVADQNAAAVATVATDDVSDDELAAMMAG